MLSGRSFPAQSTDQHESGANRGGDVGRRGDVNLGIVKLDHAATPAVTDGGFEDDFAHVNGEHGGPEPVLPVALPALAGNEKQQREIHRAQSAVTGQAWCKEIHGGGNDGREEEKDQRKQPGRPDTDHVAEDDEQPRVRDKVRPAKVDQVPGPHPPPFAAANRRPVVEQDRSPRRLRLDDERRQCSGEEHPSQPTFQPAPDVHPLLARRRRMQASRPRAPRNQPLGAPPPPPPPPDDVGGMVEEVEVLPELANERLSVTAAQSAP